MSAPRLAREVLIGLSLIAFGLIGLPALVYLVGQKIVGDYEAGIGGLYGAIAGALAEGNPYAWVLVLSPYLTVAGLRVFLRLGRRHKPVT